MVLECVLPTSYHRITFGFPAISAGLILDQIISMSSILEIYLRKFGIVRPSEQTTSFLLTNKSFELLPQDQYPHSVELSS